MVRTSSSPLARENVISSYRKILHVIPAIATRYGGPSKLVLEMCRALIARGHEAEIITSNADGLTELDLPLSRFIDYQGTRAIFFPRKFGEAFKYSPGLSGWLQRYVCEYDLVHIHAVFSWSSLAAARACRLNGIPYLVRPLGSLDPWSMGQKPLRKKLLWRLGVRKMLLGASRMHYTSDLEMEQVEASLGLRNGVVVANAINFEALEDTLSEEEFAAGFSPLVNAPYLLFIGRLHPKKKLETIITAFAGLQNQKKLQLVIAGEGQPGYAQHLAEVVANSTAVNRIQIYPWVQGRTKSALLKNCRLFLLISENENYGIAAAEAMACGKAVLVNKGVYLHQEISGSGAGWVIDNEASLGDSLNQILLDPEEIERRGGNGKLLVQNKFGWDKVTSELEQVYSQCLGD